jgi:hypothetical protein
MFRFGEQVKREYRGLRSFESLVNFVRRELQDPVGILTSADEMLNDTDVRTRSGFIFSSQAYGLYKFRSSPLTFMFHIKFHRMLYHLAFAADFTRIDS